MRSAVVILTLLAAASPGAGQSADEVVSRYLEARGGIERLRSVRTLRLTGRISLPGAEAPFVLELGRPARMRTEFTVNDQKGIQVFDGRVGWSVAPLPGETARAMGPDELREARGQADVDLSPLVDAAAKGFSVELQGRDARGGADTWKLLVRGGGGPDRVLFVDTRTHLVVRAEETRELDGEPMELVTEISDYRTVDGLTYPFRIDVVPRSQPDLRQRLEIEKVEVNPPLDEARFARPGPS